MCFAGFRGDSNIYQNMKSIKLSDYWWDEIGKSIPGRKNCTCEGYESNFAKPVWLSD